MEKDDPLIAPVGHVPKLTEERFSELKSPDERSIDSDPDVKADNSGEGSASSEVNDATE